MKRYRLYKVFDDHGEERKSLTGTYSSIDALAKEAFFLGRTRAYENVIVKEVYDDSETVPSEN